MKKIFLSILTFLFIFLQAHADDMRFIQISDLKYSQNATKKNMLNKMILDINKQKNIEFVVFTGDNIERPNPVDLENFIKEIKKLRFPFYLVLGDKELNKLKEMGKENYFKIIKKNCRKYKHLISNYVFEKNDVVFIVADGAKEVLPSTSGYFKDDTIDWIDNELSVNAEKNVFIFQHFPIVPPAKRESYYTFKADNYLNMLRKHDNVKAIISGHFGVNNEIIYNDIIHISTAPAPCYRVIDILDYETKSPTVWAQIRYAK